MKIKCNPKNEKLTKMNSNASHKLLENNNDLIYVLESNKRVIEDNTSKVNSNKKDDFEFWEDCHNKPKSIEIIDKETLSNNKSILPPANTNFKKIINKIDQNNESLSNNRKKYTYNEVGSRLYEKGRMKHELNKILFIKKLENKHKEELNECTFRPKLNRNNSLPKEFQLKLENSQIYEFNLNEDIYDRQVKWKSRSLIKTTRFKNKRNEDIWTFKPILIENQLDSIFEDKGLNSNILIKKHVERQNSARVKNKEKKIYKENREVFTPKESEMKIRTIDVSLIFK